MRKITKVEAKKTGPVARKRVAAYARVSSGKEAMLHSLSAQISYYNDYIGRRGDWEFAGVYADEAVTGTKDTRPEFQRLLADCRAGKIDMVITKSITRFARNTVTMLESARELKLLGVDIFFQKENIHTISADGEFVLTILSSFAQEESRSASENQKWRIHEMFKQGRPNTGRMLGYRLFDGKLYIVPEEAEIVKHIFADYLSGMGLTIIAKNLIGAGVPTLCNGKWRVVTISQILSNEKYTGDMLLQKTYRLDYISKKKMKNRGELPMYHVENSHEPIIDKETFAAVQREIARRAAKFQPEAVPPKENLFTSLLRCKHCERFFRRRTANAGSKYAKPAWICPTLNEYGKDMCPSQQIPEKILVEKALRVLDLPALNSEALRQHISEIHVPAHNRLIFVFTDGRFEEVIWQNPSRRDSWTDEMKQAARERQQKIIERRRENEYGHQSQKG